MVQIELNDSIAGFIFGALFTILIMFLIRTFSASKTELSYEKTDFLNELIDASKDDTTEEVNLQPVIVQSPTSKLGQHSNVSIDRGITEDELFRILNTEKDLELTDLERKENYQKEMEKILNETNCYVNKGQKYMSVEEINKSQEKYEKKINQVMLPLEEEKERLKYIKSLNLIGKQFHRFRELPNGYFLHPVYINEEKNMAHAYNNKVIGVAINDKCFKHFKHPRNSNNLTDQAIITAIVDVGGIDEFNRGYKGYQF